jgi:lysozyme
VANTAPITIEQVIRFFKGLPHQLAAIPEMEADIKANGYDVAMRRDRPWFATWSQDGKQVDLSDALKLIQQFEGCHLDAYPDPLSGGEPWTIGWGTTRYGDGRKVKKGDRLNRVEADMLLRQEVDRIAGKLRETVPHWREMGDHQQCALVSFAYNLGSGFYGSSGFETITSKLADRAWDDVPAAMLLYRNPGTNVEAGLRRRREAEGNLWAKGHLKVVEVERQPAKLTPTSSFATHSIGGVRA